MSDFVIGERFKDLVFECNRIYIRNGEHNKKEVSFYENNVTSITKVSSKEDISNDGLYVDDDNTIYVSKDGKITNLSKVLSFDNNNKLAYEDVNNIMSSLGFYRTNKGSNISFKPFIYFNKDDNSIYLNDGKNDIHIDEYIKRVNKTNLRSGSTTSNSIIGDKIIGSIRSFSPAMDDVSMDYFSYVKTPKTSLKGKDKVIVDGTVVYLDKNGNTYNTTDIYNGTRYSSVNISFGADRIECLYAIDCNGNSSNFDFKNEYSVDNHYLFEDKVGNDISDKVYNNHCLKGSYIRSNEINNTTNLGKPIIADKIIGSRINSNKELVCKDVEYSELFGEFNNGLSFIHCNIHCDRCDINTDKSYTVLYGGIVG